MTAHADQPGAEPVAAQPPAPAVKPCDTYAYLESLSDEEYAALVEASQKCGRPTIEPRRVTEREPAPEQKLYDLPDSPWTVWHRPPSLTKWITYPVDYGKRLYARMLSENGFADGTAWAVETLPAGGWLKASAEREKQLLELPDHIAKEMPPGVRGRVKIDQDGDYELEFDYLIDDKWEEASYAHVVAKNELAVTALLWNALSGHANDVNATEIEALQQQLAESKQREEAWRFE